MFFMGNFEYFDLIGVPLLLKWIETGWLQISAWNILVIDMGIKYFVDFKLEMYIRTPSLKLFLPTKLPRNLKCYVWTTKNFHVSSEREWEWYFHSVTKKKPCKLHRTQFLHVFLTKGIVQWAQYTLKSRNIFFDLSTYSRNCIHFSLVNILFCTHVEYTFSVILTVYRIRWNRTELTWNEIGKEKKTFVSNSCAKHLIWLFIELA